MLKDKRKEQYNNLKKIASESANLKLHGLKYRNIQKDQLILARASLPNGAIYFEYAEKQPLPYGCFIVLNLFEINYSPMNTEAKENSTVFIDLGSFKTLKQLVKRLEKTTLQLNKTFSGLIKNEI